MTKKLFLPLLVCIIVFSGCVTNSEFEKSITIQAPKEIVFAIITDYENYETLLPMLHDSVTIVSEEKKGNGVVWESTGSFKNHKFTSQWTVTEYIENEKVVIKDLDKGIGETVLTVKDVNPIETEYTMYLRTKMYKPYEKDFIAIYEKEMKIIKEESERQYKESIEE